MFTSQHLDDMHMEWSQCTGKKWEAWTEWRSSDPLCVVVMNGDRGGLCDKTGAWLPAGKSSFLPAQKSKELQTERNAYSLCSFFLSSLSLNCLSPHIFSSPFRWFSLLFSPVQWLITMPQSQTMNPSYSIQFPRGFATPHLSPNVLAVQAVNISKLWGSFISWYLISLLIDWSRAKKCDVAYQRIPMTCAADKIAWGKVESFTLYLQYIFCICWPFPSEN